MTDGRGTVVLLVISAGFNRKKQVPNDNIIRAVFPLTNLFSKFKRQRETEVSMAGWLQDQGSVMRAYMAQRVADRLDTEIRV